MTTSFDLTAPLAPTDLESTDCEFHTIGTLTDGFEIEWTPTHGNPRKLVFEAGTEAWIRTELEYNPTTDQWREVGFEHVEDATLTDCTNGGPTDE
ncbi:hypothetical protein [Natrononativus amylolyticus]|uniref:hypothetical protein n=1 Tax=Natrononativus amylolyticus TaxID=2963434 RepID=UPI0020CD8AF2|nr:hypothetical protein [Natrononativus amylolyticus]